LNPALKAILDETPVEARKWKFIVIHHSATASGTVQGMDRYHREERHMENGLAYHFIIGNGQGMADGAIEIGKRWMEQLDGGHLASDALNEKSIGICLVGNYDEDEPTKKQLANLEALIDFLLDRCRLRVAAVKTHQQINTLYTRCPGKHFPTKSFLAQLKRLRG
jgi:N-acetyl-anhydromuramyl-L-alanine amidase AmpD